MKKIIKKIGKIIGSEHVQSAPEDLVSYGYDATGTRFLPDIVVHPGSTYEAAQIIKVAAETDIPIVPRGAGTGLSGGSVAIRGGMVLTFDRMGRIEEPDPRNMTISVGPGALNWNVKQTAGKMGLFYPPDPSSTRICTLGGNVAENAGGPYGTKYGVTGDYVLDLEVVLASGQVIRTGSETRRNVTGYDLTGLLVGSEGTLAVVTGIVLRLLAKPDARLTALIGFDDVRAAGEAVMGIGLAGVTPAALEIIDETAIECVEEFRGGTLPRAAAAVLLVEVDGELDSVRSQLDRVLKACVDEGGRLFREAGSEAEAEAIWETRRSIAPALVSLAPSKIGEDVSVPRGKVPQMLEHIQRIGNNHGLKIAVFGHAGDGNLHPNILADRRDPDMMKRVEAAIDELFTAAVELGGTLSGEHGIGISKAGYMKKALSNEQLELMKGIKQVFDPAGIMNPGKIF